MAGHTPTSAEPTSEGKTYAVLVGDVLGSRQFRNQPLLFEWLREQLDWVNRKVPAVQPLQLTVGDEFQAAYRDIAEAFRAAVFIRLRFKMQALMEPARDQDVRIGVAYGQISVFSEPDQPFGQSGEAWWNARQAIERAETPKNRRYIPYSTQTRFHSSDLLLNTMTNAFLLALDQVLYQMDRKDVAITLDTIVGRSQKEIASKLGISQPVVSRRSKRNGVFTIASILDELERFSSA